jgi:hypothetical protein
MKRLFIDYQAFELYGYTGRSFRHGHGCSWKGARLLMKKQRNTPASKIFSMGLTPTASLEGL